MSMHKVPLTELERSGLVAHHLRVDTPSQLSDCFRLGIKWALEYSNQQGVGDTERDDKVWFQLFFLPDGSKRQARVGGALYNTYVEDNYPFTGVSYCLDK